MTMVRSHGLIFLFDLINSNDKDDLNSQLSKNSRIILYLNRNILIILIIIIIKCSKASRKTSRSELYYEMDIRRSNERS